MNKRDYEVKINIHDPITLEIEDVDWADNMEEARKQARKFKLVSLEQVWYDKHGGRTEKTAVEVGEEP